MEEGKAALRDGSRILSSYTTRHGDKVWIITNELLSGEIQSQLEGVPSRQIVEEPAARNTAPACGLAAFLIERENPDAVIGVFPSDHVIGDEPRFLKIIEHGRAGLSGA